MVDKEKPSKVEDETLENDAEKTAASENTSEAIVEEVEAELVTDAGDNASDSVEEPNDDAELVAGGGAEDEASGISPGVVFLSVLTLIGVVAAGLWALQAGRDDTVTAVDTEIEAAAPEITGAAASSSEAEKATENKSIPAKIANTVGSNEAKQASADIDTAAVEPAKKTKLPAVPIGGNANAGLQKAAKEAAQQLKTDADKIEQSETSPSDDKGDTKNTVTVDAAKQADQLAAAAKKVDPVAEAAELFASNPGDQETPADQLGEDPIAAIQSLQEEAAAKSAEEEVAALKSLTEATDTIIPEADNQTRANLAEQITAAEERLADSTVDTIQEGNNALASLPKSLSEATANTVPEASEDIAAKVAALASAPAQPSTEEVAEKFAGEIAALEESFEERTERIADALEAEKERAARQAEEIANLKRELDEALRTNQQRNNAEISRLRIRIDELQKSEEKQASTTERQTAGLLALISLQRTFDQGVPYRRELSVLRRALPNAVDYGSLNAAADSGASTLASLKERFPLAIRTTMAGNKTGAKGPVGHVMRNLQGLVSVRPATPQEGESVAAIISRAEDDLERDNLGGAIEELGALGGAASEEMQAWLVDARKRYEATRQLAEINDGLLAGVGN